MGTSEAPRILIVDDIEENLKVLTETLVEEGFHPLQAKSGERALQVARAALPDLVLLDVKMPGMDGFETIAALKADPATADIPVIFISALNQIDDKLRGFRAGAVDYVSKPFQREEVVARVTTHLELRRALREVEAEREKSERLLLAILPKGVADELKEAGRSEPRCYRDATILFSDIVDFTQASASIEPEALIGDLNEIFTAFDGIMLSYGCERIKTIGDAYMAAAGLPDPHPDHAYAMACAARDMIAWLEERNASSPRPWRIRVGLHSGSVVAGIVGTQRYIYDVFGDAVNTASRMESASEPMRVNLSEATKELLANRLPLEPRPEIEVKGKGPMRMYFVL